MCSDCSCTFAGLLTRGTEAGPGIGVGLTVVAGLPEGMTGIATGMTEDTVEVSRFHRVASLSAVAVYSLSCLQAAPAADCALRGVC